MHGLGDRYVHCKLRCELPKQKAFIEIHQRSWVSNGNPRQILSACPYQKILKSHPKKYPFDQLSSVQMTVKLFQKPPLTLSLRSRHLTVRYQRGYLKLFLALNLGIWMLNPGIPLRQMNYLASSESINVSRNRSRIQSTWRQSRSKKGTYAPRCSVAQRLSTCPRPAYTVGHTTIAQPYPYRLKFRLTTPRSRRRL